MSIWKEQLDKHKKKVYYIFLFHVVVMFCMMYHICRSHIMFLRHCVIIFKDLCFQFKKYVCLVDYKLNMYCIIIMFQTHSLLKLLNFNTGVL
jgi:hypothetical protein